MKSYNFPVLNKDQKNPLFSPSAFIPKINSKYQEYESQITKDRIMEKVTFDSNSLSSTSVPPAERLEKSLYFVTYQFKKDLKGKRFTSKLQQVLLDSIAANYASMVGNFIKRPFSKNTTLLPFLQTYFEDEHARFSTAASEIDVPHFHGLMVIHPKTCDRFECFLNEQAQEKLINGRDAFMLTSRSHNPLETVTFEKYDMATPLDKVVSYTTKYARNNRFVQGHSEELQLSAIFPRLPKEKYPFYKYAKTPIFTAEENASFSIVGDSQ